MRVRHPVATADQTGKPAVRSQHDKLAPTVGAALPQFDSVPPACRVPLPPLYMRFVLQTLQASPRLKNFVLDILSSLAGKQVGCSPAYDFRLLVWPYVLAAAC